MRPDLLDAARALSLAERIELAEAIWDTIANDAGVDQLPVPESHRRELDRRLEEMEAGPDSGSSWEEVRSRLEREG